MTLELNIDRMRDFHDRGVMRPGVGWGDAHHTACLMSALTGATSARGCVAKGWPKWLAELGTVIFDNAGELWWDRSVAFAEAVANAESDGRDYEDVFRTVRLAAILPIAMESIGEGSEPWRIECRDAVQWSIDNGGSANPKAAWAAWAAGAAGAADAEAHTRIFNATIAALRGDPVGGK